MPKRVRQRSVEPNDKREQIKRAAVACVQRFTAAKVSIDDIAQEAGVARQTIYRTLGSRREVFEAITLDRLRATAEKVRRILAKCATFEEAIVKGSVETIRLARADGVFMSVADSEHTLGIDRQLIATDSPVRDVFMSAWSEIFEKARKEGTLRSDVTNEEAADWLRNVHYLIYWRRDLSPRAQAEFIRKFALPGITCSCGKRR